MASFTSTLPTVQRATEAFIATVDSFAQSAADRPDRLTITHTFIACGGLLAVLDAGKDRDKGLDCATALVKNKVYIKLTRIIRATDWVGIGQAFKSEGLKDQAHAPNFYHELMVRDACKAVGQRLERASSQGEIAILLLRLAVRAACVDASWFGPFRHMPALEQAGSVRLLGPQAALRALLPLFGRHLARHPNAMHIVDDLLHVVYSVSEGAVQWKDSLHMAAWAGLDILETIVENTAQLPAWESGACENHTAMLLVPSIAAASLRIVEYSLKPPGGVLDPSACVANASFAYSPGSVGVLAESLAAFMAGRMPPSLGDRIERLASGEVDRGACWSVYTLMLTLQQTTRGNTSLESDYQRQTYLVDRIPWRLIKSMLDICLASGEAEFIDRESPNMTMHAQKMGNALLIIALLQTCVVKGVLLVASGLLPRCLRYLRRIVRASPPDAEAAAGRHQLPYKAAELWQRLMWQSMAPCLGALFNHLTSPWQNFMAYREAHLIAALPWSTMAAVHLDYHPVLERVLTRAAHILKHGGDAVLDGVFRTASRMQEPESAAAVLEYAPVMSQAMLCQAAPDQAPRDWLGLLISLRKYWARQWELPAARPDLFRLLPPIVLLSVILHLEERLPEGTAAIAAAQLLPIIEHVLEQEGARVPSDFTFAYTVELLMLCSGLASGTALPLLLGSAQLITCALQSTEVLSRLAIQQMEAQSGATIERRAVTQRLASMMFCAVCDLARHVPAFAGGRLSNSLGPLQVILPAYKCLSRRPVAKALLPMMDYQYARALRTCLPQAASRLVGSAAGIIERCESIMGVDVDWREGRENPRYRAFERMMHRDDALRLCRHLRLEDVAVPAASTLPAPRAEALALEGRAALLAAKAGFCCNMRCPNISCARERHVKTYACWECEQKARYCSKACQRAAWASHRLVHGLR